MLTGVLDGRGLTWQRKRGRVEADFHGFQT